MDPTELDVEVNGVLSSYRLVDLIENRDEGTMYLGFDMLKGEKPAFNLGDHIELKYALFAVDFMTEKAKVVDVDDNAFKVVINFCDLFHRLQDGFVAQRPLDCIN